MSKIQLTEGESGRNISFDAAKNLLRAKFRSGDGSQRLQIFEGGVGISVVGSVRSGDNVTEVSSLITQEPLFLDHLVGAVLEEVRDDQELAVVENSVIRGRKLLLQSEPFKDATLIVERL